MEPIPEKSLEDASKIIEKSLKELTPFLKLKEFENATFKYYFELLQNKQFLITVKIKLIEDEIIGDHGK
jgi:hypothetical protein